LNVVDQFGNALVCQPWAIYNSLENPHTSLSDPDAWLVDALGGGETDAGVQVT